MTTTHIIDGVSTDLDAGEATDFDNNRVNLDALKRLKKLEMRNERDKRLFRSTPYLGNDYEVTKGSVLYMLLTMAYINSGNSLPGTFKFALTDGSGLVTSDATAEAVISNTLSLWKDLMDIYVTKCADVDSAVDVAAVLAITWS